MVWHTPVYVYILCTDLSLDYLFCKYLMVSAELNRDFQYHCHNSTVGSLFYKSLPYWC